VSEWKTINIFIARLLHNFHNISDVLFQSFLKMHCFYRYLNFC